MTKANLTSHNKFKYANFTVLNFKATTIETTKVGSIRLQLHDVIYYPDSFVLMLCYCANLKAIQEISSTLLRILQFLTFQN